MIPIKSKILFKEEQKMSTPWIFLVIIPAIGLLIYIASITDEDGGIANPQNKDEILGLAIVGIFLFVLMVGLTVLFYKMKLITTITSEGLYIKFLPSINKERFIPKVEIHEFEVIMLKHSGIYGRHTIIKRFGQNTKKYTLQSRGNKLLLSIIDDKKIIIDTHRNEAIKSAMKKMLTKDS
jgi:hypothetical protein